MSIREAAVAGSFYPDDKEQLRGYVAQFLSEHPADNKSDSTDCPKVLIMPHAGYMYSGSVAASGYRLLEGYADKINRVVLLGPSHRVAFRGIALTESDYFSTPLGTIKVDPEARQLLQPLSQVFVSDQAHQYEHSLEVQLPFLQCTLNDFSIVPLVVGDASAEEVAEVIDCYLGNPGVLVIISTDLSHFLDYYHAQEKDHDTSQLICNKFSQLKGEQACGSRPLNGLLRSADKKALDVIELALCNSGDTCGDKRSVVGYGAYAIF